MSARHSSSASAASQGSTALLLLLAPLSLLAVPPPRPQLLPLLLLLLLLLWLALSWGPEATSATLLPLPPLSPLLLLPPLSPLLLLPPLSPLLPPPSLLALPRPQAPAALWHECVPCCSGLTACCCSNHCKSWLPKWLSPVRLSSKKRSGVMLCSCNPRLLSVLSGSGEEGLNECPKHSPLLNMPNMFESKDLYWAAVGALRAGSWSRLLLLVSPPWLLMLLLLVVPSMPLVLPLPPLPLLL
jgi:hypothetical protein